MTQDLDRGAILSLKSILFDLDRIGQNWTLVRFLEVNLMRRFDLMKNLLSKALLGGVLISTFSIINCQKPPNRRTKMDIDQKAQHTAEKVGTCTPDIAKDYEELKKSKETLHKKLVELVDKEPSPEEKEKENELLKSLAKDLNEKTEKVLNGLSSLNVEICKVTAKGADGKESVKESIESKLIEQTRMDLGKMVKAKTGDDNDLVHGGRTLHPQLKLKIKSLELADVLSDVADANGKAVIADSKVEKDPAAIQVLLKDEAKTACVTKNAHKEKLSLTQGSELQIIALNLGNSAETKRQMLEVSIAAKASAVTEVTAEGEHEVAAAGDTPIILSCYLPAKKGASLVEVEESDATVAGKPPMSGLNPSQAAKAVREALGSMVE